MKMPDRTKHVERYRVRRIGNWSMEHRGWSMEHHVEHGAS